MSRRALAFCVALAALTAAPALAQGPDEATRQRASEHFDRGIAFFNEGRHDAALAELARAYELAPAHQVLYNLARVHAALGHAVEAAAAYERYLAEAGDAIAPRRRREAEAALEEQRARIGRLVVAVDLEGATIAIDGVDVAQTPLRAPLSLSAGQHTLEARAPGHETARRAVSIAGRSETRLELALREEVVPRGTLRVASTLPEVAITVDGESVGLTPLHATLPLRAGPHDVEASRLGYRAETRRVEIAEGAEAEVSFALRREPAAPPEHLGRLRLSLPDAPSLVRVDDEPMVGADLELPIGAHHLVVEVTDRRPYEGTVRVDAGRAIEIAPALSWTLDARRVRLDAADAQRTTGVVLTIAGAAALAASLSVVIWNEAEIRATDDRIVDINYELTVPCAADFTERCQRLEEEGQTLAARQSDQNVIRGVSIAGVVVAAALAVPGVVLWLTAPDEDAVDAAARATLRLTPTGLALDTVF